jgi:hypothetical protein
VAALWEELEMLQIDKEDSVQRSVAKGNDQITQLNEIASALRDQLEKLKIDPGRGHDQAVEICAELHCRGATPLLWPGRIVELDQGPVYVRLSGTAVE